MGGAIDLPPGESGDIDLPTAAPPTAIFHPFRDQLAGVRAT